MQGTGSDRVVRAKASQGPGFLLLILGCSLSSMFAMGLFDLQLWGLGRWGSTAILAFAAVIVLFQLPRAGAEYELDDEGLRIRRFWGRVDTLPLQWIRRIAPPRDGRHAHVMLVRRFPLSLDLARPDQRALYNAFLARVEPTWPQLPPLEMPLRPRGEAQLPRDGRVKIAALEGLPSGRCLVCGSDRGVGPIELASHHGFSLVLVSYMKTRRVPISVCRMHRWARRIASILTPVIALGVIVAAILSAVAHPEYEGLLWAVAVAMLLFAANEGFRYVFDALFLRVRLGWLSMDSQSTHIRFYDEGIRKRVHEHIAGPESYR